MLDRKGWPLQPCTPARARKLLAAGRAVVHRHTPFVIRLKDRVADRSRIDGVEVGIDPGSRFTGLAMFRDDGGTRIGLFAVEVRHRGGQIRDRMSARSALLNIDHIHPRARGGSDRVSNLTLACVPCNGTKASTPIQVFLADRPDLIGRINRQVKAPLRDAAAAGSTRPALWRALNNTGLAVLAATGGRTKWNRHRTGSPKSHTLDALHVGELDMVASWPATVLVATGTGRGRYSRTRTDKFGFPRLRLPRTKRVHGFATGDLVRAVVPAGLKRGTHLGRVAVRTTGSFNIRTSAAVVQGIHHRHLRLLQRADGWAYTTQMEPAHSIAAEFPRAPRDCASLRDRT